MKKYGWVILLTFCMATAFFVCLHVQSLSGAQDDPLAFLSFRVYADSSTETYEIIHCWSQDDNHCFVFLPSYADFSRIKVQMHLNRRCMLGGKELAGEMNCDGFSLDTDYELAVEGVPLTNLRFVQSANVAAMYVYTASGSMQTVHADKRNSERVSVSVYTAEGKMNYHSSFTDQIRGHGNSTWLLYPKKPYQLSLQNQISLLNLRAGYKWILLANETDGSHLRNKIIFDFAQKVQGYQGFAPGCAFVDLYLNGEYTGLYLLTEKNEVSEARLNLSTGSTLFDLEMAVRTEEKNSFLLNPGVAAEIRYPAPCTNKQKDSLQQRLADFQTALLSSDYAEESSGKTWDEYIDMDSWGRKYLMEEVFENYDAGAFSQYFFWNGTDDKLYAGPCWDYDNTLGVSLQDNPRNFIAQREWKYSFTYTPWFHGLWQKEAFRESVYQIYRNDFLPELEKLLHQTIETEQLSVAAATENNRLRWGRVSPREATDQMKSFLEKRIDFLNSAWIDGVQYNTILLKATGEYRFYCTEHGTICEDLPTPAELEEEEGLIWYREDTDEPFDYSTVITEDLVLYLKKQPQQ